MKDEDAPPWNPPRREEEAKRFPKAKLQNLTWEEDIGEPVSEFEKMNKAVEGNRPLYSETLTQQDADKNDSLKNCYLM